MSETKTKAGAGGESGKKAAANKKDPSSSEELLYMVVAYFGPASLGTKAHEFFHAVDKGGHSVSSFENKFRAIKAKANEILDANPEAKGMTAGTITPKKAGGRKRKAVEEEDAENGGDSDGTPIKKKRAVGKAKKETAEDAEEVAVKTEEATDDNAAMGSVEATE